MTPPIVCIVGKSGSGKTTFLEELIPELLARGYRPVYVKAVDVVLDHGRPWSSTTSTALT